MFVSGVPYDTFGKSSAVAVLLETARALRQSPALKNDVLALGTGAR